MLLAKIKYIYIYIYIYVVLQVECLMIILPHKRISAATLNHTWFKFCTFTVSLHCCENIQCNLIWIVFTYASWYYCSDPRSFWKYQSEGHCCHVALLGIRITSSCENDWRLLRCGKTIEVLILHAFALTSITHYPHGIGSEALWASGSKHAVSAQHNVIRPW